MNQEAALIRQGMKTPRSAAVAGIIFSLLLMASFLLVRISIPANPLSEATVPGGRTVPRAEKASAGGPFAGVCSKEINQFPSVN
jgi:hypothetical protein